MNEKSPTRSFRDLKVWQLGIEMANRVYAMSASFPDHEKFGLTNQLRRAVVSIPANIAEGNARDSTKEYLRFLSIAIGSLAEVETLLELAKRFNYGNPEIIVEVFNLLDEERRMLRGLQRSLRSKL
jgi:four helix bundle protein